MKRSLLPIIDTRAEYIFIKTGKSWTASDASSRPRLEFAWPVFLSFPFFFFQVKFPSSGKKLGYETPLEARQTFAVLKRGHGDAFPPPPIYRGKRVARVLVLGDELGNTCGQVCSRVYTNFPLYIYVAWWPKCFVNVAKERKKKKNSERKRDTDENSPFSLRRCLKDQLRIHRIHHDSNVYTCNIISFGGWWKKDPSKFARILRAKNIDRRYSPRSRGGVSIRESSSA